MPFVTSTDGVKIFYTTIGEGEPLVLSHGSTHTWQSWEDLGYVDALKDRYRLILIDTRGHGESDRPHDQSAYVLTQHVADVLAVLDDVGIERCQFWGYSIGGMIGFRLAAEHPERLRSLIAYGAHPYPSSLKAKAWIDGVVEMLRQGIEAWIAHLEDVGVFDQYPNPEGRRTRLLDADAEAIAALALASREDEGVGDALAGMRMPCLIILGEQELDEQREAARQAAVEMPRAEFISVPGTGHAMVHADVIMPYVEPFLDRTRRSDGT